MNNSQIFDIENIVNGNIGSFYPEIYNIKHLVEKINKEYSIANIDEEICIIKYGNWEFTYYKENLYHLFVYNKGMENSIDEKKVLKFSVNELYEFLSDKKLTWVEEIRYKTKDQTQININTGCKIVIDILKNKIDKLFIRFD